MPAAGHRPKPVVLLILDGWGYREDPADNALAQVDVAFVRKDSPLRAVKTFFTPDQAQRYAGTGRAG